MSRRMNTAENRLASRWAPEGSQKIEHELGVVYTYTSKSGKHSAIAYRGTAGQHEWHYSYPTVERRDKAVAEWLEGLGADEARKIARRAERSEERKRFNEKLGDKISGDISLPQTAELIRRTLKQAFPLTKFSVRCDSYANGCSIDATWTDGPTDKQVQRILDRFEGEGFDGMTDCSYYCGKRMYKGEPVDFCGAYVRGSRRISNTVLAAVADRVAYECGVSAPKIDEHGNLSDYHSSVPFQWRDFWNLNDSKKYLTLADIEAPGHMLAHDSHQNEMLSTLIHRIAANVSMEVEQPADLPEYIDVAEKASTGRADFEQPMYAFENHEDARKEIEAVETFNNVVVFPTVQ